jgi:hypothetical protein
MCWSSHADLGPARRGDDRDLSAPETCRTRGGRYEFWSEDCASVRKLGPGRNLGQPIVPNMALRLNSGASSGGSSAGVREL